MNFDDLRIYDKNLELITILPEYLSINWEVKFGEFGLGEIELERTDKTVELLTKNKYLFVFQDDLQSIVTGYKIGETITVFLRTTEWFLTKYVVERFKAEELKNANGAAIWTKSSLCEYILKTYLHPEFNVEFIGIDGDDSDVSQFISEDDETVYAVIKKILNDDKYGFRFFYDSDKERFIFKLLLAKENEEVLLCDEYKTTYESEYSFDIQKEATGGIYYQKVTDMGKWDARINEPFLTKRSENYAKYYTVSEDGNAMGLSLKKGDIILCKDKSGEFSIVKKAEPFLVKINPSDDGIFSFSKILSSREESAAKEEIKSAKALDMLTCKTILTYKTDFNLGDIVTVKFFAGDFSFQKKKIIKEIHLWDEPDDMGAMPTTVDIE